MNRYRQTMIQTGILFAILTMAWPAILPAGNFYQENRNGKVFVLQVDPVTRIETVYNHEKVPLFLAPGAKRLAVLPTAGWGEYTNNAVPTGSPQAPGTTPGDLNGIITLRLTAESPSIVRFDIYRGANTKLYTLRDTLNCQKFMTDQIPFDIAVSQFMGTSTGYTNPKDTLRVYLFLGTFGIGNNPAIFRFDFKNNVLQRESFKSRIRPTYGSPPFNNITLLNWTNIIESGDINTAQSINVNCTSPTDDLLVYHPTRQYSLQHVWQPQANNGNSWGINYLMTNSRVLKANLSNPLTNDLNQMTQIFDVGVDLGDAFVDTLMYYRSYYNHGNTFVLNNVNTNTSLSNIYYDIRDDAGQLVEIRDGSPTGPVLEITRVNPNPTVLGHGASAMYGLSCRNALTGKELIVYEPVYKINQAAVDKGEISDTNRNNVPDHIDNDGKGYFGYRPDYLIDRPNGSALNSDYVLDFVIAHRFNLSGVTANTEFSYQEYAIERDPSASPSRLIPGEIVRFRVGNIWHRDPDIYGEYNQFGWDANPGKVIFFYVGNPGEPYNVAARSNTRPQKRNSGHILGVEVTDTSYATADFFGVVGNDDYNQGQGDLYFLSKQFGSYIRPRIVASNNPYVPPVTGYGRWWKYQYDRATYYGISRTQWLDPLTTRTTWINRGSFFIGDSIYSQMVYNINCGCRGQRFDNFQLDHEASAPLNDFAIVNIGAPPWVTGGLYPTIRANTGTTIFEPDAQVTFVGNYSGRTDLLAGGGVGFRFVILKDKFIDSGNPFDEPFLADGGKKVVDSYNEVGGYLTSPVWNYTFRRSILPRGTDVATFNVYLGIKYNYRDYSLLPYPAYSWEPVPSKDFFAWSDSKNGAYIDGQYHEILSGSVKFGAPLRITIDSRENLTPEHPLAIDKVEVMVQGGLGQKSAWDATDGCYVASQSLQTDPLVNKVKLVTSGGLMFLSEIPEPRDTYVASMGGIMPADDHFRVLLDSDNKQYFASPRTPFPESEFARDLAGISYAWYVRAKITPYGLAERSFTQTDPSRTYDHLLYRGNPTDHEGWQVIATGTLDPTFQPNRSVPGLFEDTSTTPRVTLTPDYRPSEPNRRRFRFTLETPWMRLPVPLDGGLPAGDLRDKYSFRVAFQYKVGKWSKVTVKNYDRGILTDTYSASRVDDIEFPGDDPTTQVERSYLSAPNPLPYAGYRWPTGQRCVLRVKDVEGPTLDGFALSTPLTSGDAFPAADIGVALIDNNPHDYMHRYPPTLRMAFRTGRDQHLNLRDELALGFDFSLATTAAPFDGVPGYARDTADSTDGENLFYRTGAAPLSNVTTVVPTTFAESCQGKLASITYRTPAGSPLVAARTLAAPAFNPHRYSSLFWVYDSPDSDPTSNEPPPILVTDGSKNPLSRGVASFTARVFDNDAPQIRVFINDQVNLDLMVEVAGGIKDGTSTLAHRTLTVKNMKSLEDFIFQAQVSTSTATNVGPFEEVYDLAALKPVPPSNYTVTKPLQADKLPLKVFPDARFRVTAQAFDHSGPGRQLDVSLAIPNYKPEAFINRYEEVFRRGLTGNTYHVEATVTDPAGNRVILRIPLEIGAPGLIDVRTIEESSHKNQ